MGFTRIADAMPCMLFSRFDPMSIQRHGWKMDGDVVSNAQEASIDGRLFVKLFKRSPIG